MQNNRKKLIKKWNPLLRNAERMGFAGKFQIDKGIVAQLLENQAKFEKEHHEAKMETR